MPRPRTPVLWRVHQLGKHWHCLVHLIPTHGLLWVRMMSASMLTIIHSLLWVHCGPALAPHLSYECWQATGQSPPTCSSHGCTVAIPLPEVDLCAHAHASVSHSQVPLVSVLRPCLVDTMVCLIEPGYSHQVWVSELWSPQYR